MWRPSIDRPLWTWLALAALIVCLGLAARQFLETRKDLFNRRETVAAAWAELENGMLARAALLPALANILQKTSPQETKLADALLHAHSNLQAAVIPEEKMLANSRIDTLLGRLEVLASITPRLHASNVLDRLQTQLDLVENRILQGRQKYNQALHDYNVQLQQFPQNAVAALSGFHYNDAYFTTNLAARMAQ